MSGCVMDEVVQETPELVRGLVAFGGLTLTGLLLILCAKHNSKPNHSWAQSASNSNDGTTTPATFRQVKSSGQPVCGPGTQSCIQPPIQSLSDAPTQACSAEGEVKCRLNETANRNSPDLQKIQSNEWCDNKNVSKQATSTGKNQYLEANELFKKPNSKEDGKDCNRKDEQKERPLSLEKLTTQRTRTAACGGNTHTAAPHIPDALRSETAASEHSEHSNKDNNHVKNHQHAHQQQSNKAEVQAKKIPVGLTKPADKIMAMLSRKKTKRKRNTAATEKDINAEGEEEEEETMFGVMSLEKDYEPSLHADKKAHNIHANNNANNNVKDNNQDNSKADDVPML